MIAGTEEGFALILAILALMLLTFLGLTLATTTSTELRIATNYRWNTQAVYNAEAGIEAGKRILQSLNWARVAARPSAGLVSDRRCPCPWSRRLNRYPLAGTIRLRAQLGDGGLRQAGNGVGYGAVLHDERRRTSTRT